jgi:hypothetical protein
METGSTSPEAQFTKSVLSYRPHDLLMYFHVTALISIEVKKFWIRAYITDFNRKVLRIVNLSLTQESNSLH